MANLRLVLDLGKSGSRGLVEGGYEGPILYEMCSPLRGGGSLENLDACARKFLDWVRDHGYAG